MNLIQQRKAERDARAALAAQQVRAAAEEAQLTPSFDPEPQTEFERALAQAVLASADQLRSELTDSKRPQAQVVAARALYAADATALYATIRTQAGTSQRDLGPFEVQVTLLWLKRGLDAAITRALAQVDAIREDARHHQAIRLHAFLKGERAKRDRQTLTVSAVQRFDERDASESEANPESTAVKQAPKARIVHIPPIGHPDRERMLAEAMAERAEAE